MVTDNLISVSAFVLLFLALLLLALLAKALEFLLERSLAK